jgi:hypothetical protein
MHLISSRIACTVTLAITLAGLSVNGPAKAGDDSDCCSDLEDKIANLEAKANKGNEKVSVTVSGWVTKSWTLWRDGAGPVTNQPKQ